FLCVSPPASTPPPRAVAEILVKGGVVSLHSRGCAGVALSHGAVDHIEACLPLVQPQLVVGRRSRCGKIDSAPFDVEDTIGRRAGHRGENAACSARETR